MIPSRVTYSNVLVKQRIESWGENLCFDPEEQILMLIEDKFGAKEIAVIEARAENDFLMLKVEADVWTGAREFALLRSGSLAW